MDNLRQQQQKNNNNKKPHNIICVGLHSTQKNTNNVNKSWALYALVLQLLRYRDYTIKYTSHWKKNNIQKRLYFLNVYKRGRRARDRMVVGFSTTCAIRTYHHYRCGFESPSWWGQLDTNYVIMFVNDLRQVVGFLRVLWFPPPINLTATI